MIAVSLDGLRGARTTCPERTNHNHSTPAARIFSPETYRRTKSGISCLPYRNIVLVVDDDPGVLKGVQRLLRAHAYEPILFSSADAFKNHTDFETVVCVILDINLNDGSGIELRHRLDDAGVSVPVIYMTGNDNPAVRKAALDSGCIAFLTKPFSAQSLIEPLKKASAGRS
jgi:FixJ family two-component response regulator